MVFSCSSTRMVRFWWNQNLTILELEHDLELRPCQIWQVYLYPVPSNCLRSKPCSTSKSFIGTAPGLHYFIELFVSFLQHEETIRQFLDRTLTSRLGIRMLCEHHLSQRDEKVNTLFYVVNFCQNKYSDRSYHLNFIEHLNSFSV